MATPPKGYGPAPRRAIAGWLLDWAAGVLIGILLAALVIGVLTLFIPVGPRRLSAMFIVMLFAWPVGVPLGVWLSAGKPLTPRPLAYAFSLALIGAGLSMCPYWLDVDSSLLRALGSVTALLTTPIFARIGHSLGRRSEV